MKDDARAERADAVNALETEFSELFIHFRRRMTANADRLSPGMLPGAYKVFTTIVRRQSTTLSALADLLVTDKGQLSRTVRELEQLGLVRREPDPNDGRSNLIIPTEEGLRRLTEARAPHEHALLAALDEWEVDDIRNLSRLLHALVHGAPPTAASAS